MISPRKMLEESALCESAFAAMGVTPGQKPRRLREARSKSHLFGYYINKDERGEFSADVRDLDDKTVFELQSDDETGEVWAVEDGFMKDTGDIAGLELYLKKHKIIGPSAELLTMKDFEEYRDEIDADDNYGEAKERYTADDLQKMDRQGLLKLIRSKAVTYAEVDNALEKTKQFKTLDWLGDQLAKDDLKGGQTEGKFDDVAWTGTVDGLRPAFRDFGISTVRRQGGSFLLTKKNPIEGVSKVVFALYPPAKGDMASVDIDSFSVHGLNDFSPTYDADRAKLRDALLASLGEVLKDSGFTLGPVSMMGWMDWGPIPGATTEAKDKSDKEADAAFNSITATLKAKGVAFTTDPSDKGIFITVKEDDVEGRKVLAAAFRKLPREQRTWADFDESDPYVHVSSPGRYDESKGEVDPRAIKGVENELKDVMGFAKDAITDLGAGKYTTVQTSIGGAQLALEGAGRRLERVLQMSSGVVESVTEAIDRSGAEAIRKAVADHWGHKETSWKDVPALPQAAFNAIKKYVAALPVVGAPATPDKDFIPADWDQLKASSHLGLISGKRRDYIVDTQGYDYPRYIVSIPKGYSSKMQRQAQPQPAAGGMPLGMADEQTIKKATASVSKLKAAAQNMSVLAKQAVAELKAMGYDQDMTDMIWDGHTAELGIKHFDKLIDIISSGKGRPQT